MVLERLERTSGEHMTRGDAGVSAWSAGERPWHGNLDLMSHVKSTLIVNFTTEVEEMYGFLWQNIARGSWLFHPLLDHFASTSLSGCGASGTVWLLKCLGSLCCEPARQRIVAPNIGVAWDEFSCFAFHRALSPMMMFCSQVH